MIGFAPARALAALAIVAVVLAVGASAEDLQGWRTSDGRLYFGAEPPSGSTKIEAVHPTPTAVATPTEKIPEPRPPRRVPQPTATPRPASTATPAPTVLPAAPAGPPPRHNDPPAARPSQPAPESERLRLGAPAAWRREPACGSIATIRDVRPTIDFEADQLTMSGEVFVATAGPVKDVRVCLGGSCTLVAGGKVLVGGESARFTLTVPRRHPKGLAVECFVEK
jgi:hypothetical protein